MVKSMGDSSPFNTSMFPFWKNSEGVHEESVVEHDEAQNIKGFFTKRKDSSV